MDQQELLMQMMAIMNPEMAPILQMLKDQGAAAESKPKKRSTAYQRKYKAAFKKVQKRYKLKSGKWKKGGFKSAVREAHRMAKRGGKK